MRIGHRMVLILRWVFLRAIPQKSSARARYPTEAVEIALRFSVYGYGYVNM